MKKELSENEVISIITSMPTKSNVSDVLPTKLLKMGLDIILPVLTKLVYSSLEHGLFTDSWKTTITRVAFSNSTAFILDFYIYD